MSVPKLPRRPVSIACQQALSDQAVERPQNDQGRVISNDGAGRQGLLGKKIRERAALTGMLPHEILLTLARGEPIQQRILNPETGEVRLLPHYPDIKTMVEAAKAASPYYAPKLAATQILPGVSDADLDELITSLAAEAGVTVGPGRESEEGEDQEGTRGTE